MNQSNIRPLAGRFAEKGDLRRALAAYHAAGEEASLNRLLEGITQMRLPSESEKQQRIAEVMKRLGGHMDLLKRNGQTGYLVLGVSGTAVALEPGTDREKAVMTALIYREWDPDAISLSVRLPPGTETVKAIDRDIVKTHALVTLMLMTDPPEGIETIEELDSVIMGIFKYPEPRAYEAFIERMPSKPGKRELGILSALLERGEEFSVISSAEGYLMRAGYDQGAISRLYSKKERSRRFSAGEFKIATGCEIPHIKTREDLEQALGKAESKESAAIEFLHGAPTGLSQAMIEDVVVPLLRKGGAKIALAARSALMRNGYTPDEIEDL